MVDSHGTVVEADSHHAFSWSEPPSWLRIPPSADDVFPPVVTRHQLLPVDQLTWEDFERLCLRLTSAEGDLVHTSVLSPSRGMTESVARIYGVHGQAQYGIDIYVRDPLVLGETPLSRRYICLQSRRTREVTKTKLARSVDDFLAGNWADDARKFVYATSSSARSTELLEEVERLAAKLAEQSIEFELWDQEEISERLKPRPSIVDDFFGRHWVKEFCGHPEAEALGSRLDTHQVAKFRRELAKVYSAAFGVADSGLIAFRSSEARPAGLLKRFVTPDLVSSSPQSAALPQSFDDLGEPEVDYQELQAAVADADPWSNFDPEGGAWVLRRSSQKQRRVESPRVTDRRPADHWIGTEPLQVIVGDPGAGKSTLLRYLVLDLLSEEPSWKMVADRWGQRLPVWLPFHFYTQRVASQTGAPASVGNAIRAWLEQYDAGHIWPLVEQALGDQRLLLVVDGLDEWVNDEAGEYALTALQAFAESRTIPLVVSTRPSGLNKFTLGGGWAYKRIATLVPSQQRLLALHYFSSVIESHDQQSSHETVERAVDAFLAQVRDAPDLRAISGTPLFLVLLIGLHLSSSSRLPVDRFEVYEQAVKLLIADHPAKRRAAASVTTQRQRLSDRQLREILARVAYLSQVKGDISTLQDEVLRRDVLTTLSDPSYLAMAPRDARDAAEQLLDVAEGELGILVRHGPTEVGFLHRILQEQLVAEHITGQFELSELKTMIADYVGDPRWREVILATMWRLTRPPELRDLIQVIRERIDESPEGLRAREILAEVTFGPYGLPAAEIRANASDVIDVIETHSYGPHRARLLESVIAGLEGATSGAIVRECLERWTLLVQTPTSELVGEIAHLPPGAGVSEIVCNSLMMGLRNHRTWIAYPSAVAIAGRCSSDEQGIEGEREQLYSDLLSILSDPPSGLAQAAALIVLALEWRDEPTVVAILDEAREHTDESVRIVALSDALGILRSTLSMSPSEVPTDVRTPSDIEREWLVEKLRSEEFTDIHSGLLAACISEVVRDQSILLDDFVVSLADEGGALLPLI